MIEYINSKGIRSAIISGIGYSVGARKELARALLPNNIFETILSGITKGLTVSDRNLFELILEKPGLELSEPWYCGDNIKTGVEEAARCGVYPV